MENILYINEKCRLPISEIRLDAVRSQGPGGQNVNKVSSAVHLRFDIKASSLPDETKEKISVLKDKRITKDGIIVIKAQRYRTQEKNREDALERLKQLLSKAFIERKKRKPTSPSKSAKKKRMDNKTRHSRVKKLRGRISLDPSSD